MSYIKLFQPAIHALEDEISKLDLETDEIDDWIRAHPDAHPDERRSKIALRKSLEREVELLRGRVNEQLSAWVNRNKR